MSATTGPFERRFVIKTEQFRTFRVSRAVSTPAPAPVPFYKTPNKFSGAQLIPSTLPPESKLRPDVQNYTVIYA